MNSLSAPANMATPDLACLASRVDIKRPTVITASYFKAFLPEYSADDLASEEVSGDGEQSINRQAFWGII